MREIIQEIIDRASKGDWEIFRINYNSLSFDELRFINNEFYKLYPEQAHFNLTMFYEIIEKAYQKNSRNRLRIVELGPSIGDLAKQVLKKYDDMVEYWIGYEMAASTIEDCVVENRKYNQVLLNDYFFNTSLPELDMFVATHVLEHMTFGEVEKTIETVRNSKFVMIELPRIDLMAKSWTGYGGSHILKATIGEIENILIQRYYSIFYSKRYPMLNWVSAWEKE